MKNWLGGLVALIGVVASYLAWSYFKSWAIMATPFIVTIIYSGLYMAWNGEWPFKDKDKN